MRPVQAASCDVLVLVLGDQLSHRLASLRASDKARTVVLMAEVAEETTYVRHHKKKIAFVLSAMRHFAEELRADGWRVDYVGLTDDENTGSLGAEVARAIRRWRPSRLRVVHSGEWRVQKAVRGWAAAFSLPVDILPDDRFLCSIEDFARWADGRRALRMEWFYREMRRRTGILMEGERPAGGRWNFDRDNRKPAEPDLLRPKPARFAPDAIVREVLDLVARRFADHPGDLEPFSFAVERDQALSALDHFVRHSLPSFGDHQDAMLRDDSWLHHSVLSPYLNVGLLDPLEVCRAAEAEWRAGRAPLNSVEGFVRQIIGWREYVRGVYWSRMPAYAVSNELAANRPLPSFYWTGETPMACVSTCVKQTMREAYAHHIQRLMVTGTFALLAGVSPQALHEWYLAVYIDAFEWVELPNTVGMSQFADGGVLGSKPYAASGAYIDRMSDYCRGCAYDVKWKTGSRACPFNYLYWDFLRRHRERFEANPRIGPTYRTYDRMSAEQRGAIAGSAAAFLDALR